MKVYRLNSCCFEEKKNPDHRQCVSEKVRSKQEGSLFVCHVTQYTLEGAWTNGERGALHHGCSSSSSSSSIVVAGLRRCGKSK